MAPAEIQLGLVSKAWESRVEDYSASLRSEKNTAGIRHSNLLQKKI